MPLCTASMHLPTPVTSTSHGQSPAGKAFHGCTCSPGYPVTGVKVEVESQGLMLERESSTSACRAEGGHCCRGKARRVKKRGRRARGHVMGQIPGLSSGAGWWEPLCFLLLAPPVLSNLPCLLQPSPPCWGNLQVPPSEQRTGIQDRESGVRQFQNQDNEPAVLLSFVLF